jgi:hypothetical protein
MPGRAECKWGQHPKLGHPRGRQRRQPRWYVGNMDWQQIIPVLVGLEAFGAVGAP